MLKLHQFCRLADKLFLLYNETYRLISVNCSVISVPSSNQFAQLVNILSFFLN